MVVDLENIAELRNCIKGEARFFSLYTPTWMGHQDLIQDVIEAAIKSGRAGKKFGPLRIRSVILMKLREVRHQSLRMREVKLEVDEQYRDLNIEEELTEDFFHNRAQTPEEIYAEKEEWELCTNAIQHLPPHQAAEIRRWVTSAGGKRWSRQVSNSIKRIQQLILP